MVPSTRSARRVRRILSLLCATYLFLLVYASLMPFDFAADRATAGRHLDRALGAWPLGHAVRVSRSDMLSNLLLYVPLGLLLATRRRLSRRGAGVGAALLATLAAAATSLAIEAGQLFSIWRIASVQDWVLNSLGGLTGGAAGALWGRGALARLIHAVRRRFVRRPVSLVAALLLLLLAADGLFPFLPTLDVSQVKRNLRASHVSLSAGLAEHPWHHWAVRRVGVYAALAVLLGASSPRPSGRRWLGGALAAAGLAAAVEACKPFIVSRSANVANAATSAAGALLGLLGGWLLAGRLTGGLKARLAVLLLAGYVVYMEWEPFVFRYDGAEVRSKVPSGPEWLPLYHYAMGARTGDVRPFLRTVLVAAALTCAAAVARGRRPGIRRGRGLLTAGLAMGAFGLVLEAGQLLIPGRVPSVTDVLCFAVGGVLGAHVWRSRAMSRL